MILQCNNDRVTIVSEDILEAKYLEQIFNSDVKIVKNTMKIRNGFHITGEKETRITFEKVKQ